MPVEPRVEPFGDGAHGKNLAAVAHRLNLPREMSGPVESQRRVIGKGPPERRQRERADLRRRGGDGIAVITGSVRRCLGQHGAGFCALQHDRSAVGEMAYQFDGAGADEVHRAHTVAATEQRAPAGQSARRAGGGEQTGGDIIRHDLDHVLRDGVMARSAVPPVRKECPLSRLFLIFSLAVLPLLALPALAQQADHGHRSKYAGEEARPIKSLSQDDIAELRRGGGWGLAKAAELNGVPGPAHLLELKARIPLDAGQVAKIEAIFAEMRAKAITQGEQLIALERALENRFRDGTIDDAGLRTMLAEIAEARRDLRYIHLATHLQTPGILSPEQIATYNALRGYSSGDPCANVPEGHDAALWRRHNGCG